MSVTEFEQSLNKALIEKSSLLELHAILVDFRNGGGERDDALNVLEKLRTSATEEKVEDVLLELMDFIVGFCSPQMMIWPPA